MTGRPTSFTAEHGDLRPVEIYALCEPDTGEIRYIGKANDSTKRFFSHIRDSRRRTTPVYQWIRSLTEANRAPVMRVLEITDQASWKVAERRLIAEHRAAGDLLNLSKGGNEPFCPANTRAINGHKASLARVSTPEKARIYKLKRDIGDALKRGHVSEATKEKLRYAARKRPELFGHWLCV